jgi:hypothetical protein
VRDERDREEEDVRLAELDLHGVIFLPAWFLGYGAIRGSSAWKKDKCERMKAAFGRSKDEG